MIWKSTQNSDGGWAYSRGGSWTEPTALVLLAQLAVGVQDSFNGGIGFLRAAARPDGGFRPQSGVDESTWVTSLTTLLPPEILGRDLHARAMLWLKGQTGRETSWPARLLGRVSNEAANGPEGWPWFPGASAWVVPTSLAILAFEQAARRSDEASLRQRIDNGRRFLLSKICADGGWNYGTPQALGRDADSYPETTGIALLALHGVPDAAGVARAKVAALRQLRNCRTAEGIAWLSMGLAAHGVKPAISSDPTLRTTSDHALTVISRVSKNPFLSI